MEWIDITLPMREEYPGWPGDIPFRRRLNAEIGIDGADFNLSGISTSLHFGTHVDAPYHYRGDGKRVDEIELNLLVGPCLVVQVERIKGNIGVKDIEGRVPPGTLRLLVKTVNSRRLHEPRFHEEYVAFSAEAVSWLLDRGVRLLGIDYYSIGPYSEDGCLVHRLFFRGNDTVALEAVDLGAVEPGEYQLICLPLKVSGAEGAPARVLLGRLSDTGRNING